MYNELPLANQNLSTCAYSSESSGVVNGNQKHSSEDKVIEKDFPKKSFNMRFCESMKMYKAYRRTVSKAEMSARREMSTQREMSTTPKENWQDKNCKRTLMKAENASCKYWQDTNLKHQLQ